MGCDLSRDGNTHSSGVRLNIDSGPQRDAGTFDFRGDFHMGVASLSSRYFTADIDASQLSRPAGSTVSRTVAENQDHRVWNYEHDRQDMFEAVCDVTDISGVFLDHPSLVGAYAQRSQEPGRPLLTRTEPQAELPTLTRTTEPGPVERGPSPV